MRTEEFKNFKTLLAETDRATIYDTFIIKQTEDILTCDQIRELIDEKILPRLDCENSDSLINRFDIVADMGFLPFNLCYTCLEICPGGHRYRDELQINLCEHCGNYKCSKCMPMINTQYCDEDFTETICIKCLSNSISKPDGFLKSRGWFLELSEIWKHFHIIPRKMDSELQKKIADGAVEMQARPSGSIYKEAKEDFERNLL